MGRFLFLVMNWFVVKESTTLLFTFRINAANERYLVVYLRHEAALRDEGRSFGTGLQGQVPNHLKLLWSKARVVSVKEKSWLKTVAGRDQGDEHKRTTDEVSKTKRRCRNWRRTLLQDKSRGNLFTAWAASGIKVA